jgi:4-hydroxy-tetrahydrodipicolinate reductase
VKPGSPHIGKPLSSFFPSYPTPLLFDANYEKMCQDSDVIIDVSHRDALSSYLPYVLKAHIPLVIGVTGYDENRLRLIREIASHIPILQAPNFALGIPFLAQLIEICASTLKKSSEVTIKEWHHEKKKDSPSGTALELAKSLKTKPEIFSYREGDIVGTHTVSFALENEIIELTHKTLSRDLYAEGAIKAATFLHSKPNGFYQMRDLLPIV